MVARLLDYLLLIVGLSPALLLPFGQVVQANENTTALASPYVYHLWGNDKVLPTTLTAWKEVDLAYARMFPYDRARQPHPPAGCVVLPTISTRSNRQGTGIKTTPVVLMLRCWERIDLLRPAQWVSNRLQQQHRQGYLVVSMPAMGINDVRVHIVAVKSSLFNPTVLAMKHALSRPVIGIFIRHTMNVKQYTFKDTITGKIDRIKATPNHPFYVDNRQRYIPVSDLSPYDKMVNVPGNPVILVCPPGKTSHCGQPYHPGQVITVYNLEVYGQHRYFAGKAGIIVHNGYYCDKCNQKFTQRNHLKRHKLSVHSDARPFACDVCGRRFKLLDYLRPHKKIHTGEKPYKCEICNRRFRRNVELKEHIKTKTHRLRQAKLDGVDVSADISPALSLVSGSSKGAESELEPLRERSLSPIDPMLQSDGLSDSMPPIDGNQLSEQLSKIVDTL